MYKDKKYRETYLAKFKLYLVLHGIPWNDYFSNKRMDGCNVCPSRSGYHECKKTSDLWVNKEGNIFPHMRTTKEMEIDTSTRFCIGFIKYV